VIPVVIEGVIEGVELFKRDDVKTLGFEGNVEPEKFA